MSVRLTVADAQGLTWHYEPDSLVGMPDVTFAPQQQPAQQYDPPRAAPPLPQAPNMTFFVTGAGPGKGADLGGLEGADQHCQQLAQRHGAGGKTWHAYLSNQPTARVSTRSG